MISKEYLNLLQKLRESKPLWGCTAYRHAADVKNALEWTDSKSILDFGAGTCSLREELAPNIEYVPFDPAIPGISSLPEGRFDLVVAIDVLEHVEDEYIAEVLDTIYQKAEKGVFLLISTVKAGQILPDGRNAHLSVYPGSWWAKQLQRYQWDQMEYQQYGTYVTFCARKQGQV